MFLVVKCNQKSTIITKVCIPGLHLSLGIFLRLWNLLEESCNELDLRVALAPTGQDVSDTLSAKLEKRFLMKAKLEEKRQYTLMLEQMVTYFSLTLPTPQQTGPLKELTKEAAANRKTAEEMVNN